MITRAGVTPPATAPATAPEDRTAEAPSPAAWVRTLGRLELMEGTPEAPGARLMGPSKPVALLAYLALAPRRRATRDQLVALLWSDAEPERARSTLRQTLWALRQRLGDGALVTDGDDVVLAQPLVTDCERFLAAVAQGALADAWARYGGLFIPDFALLGGAGFEHWAAARRWASTRATQPSPSSISPSTTRPWWPCTEAWTLTVSSTITRERALRSSPLSPTWPPLSA